MKKENTSLDKAMLAFLTFINDFQEESIANLIRDFSEKQQPTKLFYNLKEVSHITGLSVRAIKERYRRGTLQVVYDNVTPLIPADSLNELLEKLNRQIMNKKRAA